MDGSSPAERNAMAQRLISRNKLSEALDLLNETIRQDPRLAETFENRAVVFEALGMHPQAQADRRKVATLRAAQPPSAAPPDATATEPPDSALAAAPPGEAGRAGDVGGAQRGRGGGWRRSGPGGGGAGGGAAGGGSGAGRGCVGFCGSSVVVSPCGRKAAGVF